MIKRAGDTVYMNGQCPRCECTVHEHTSNQSKILLGGLIPKKIVWAVKCVHCLIVTEWTRKLIDGEWKNVLVTEQSIQ